MASQTLNLPQRIAKFPHQWRSGLPVYRGLGALALLMMLWAGYLLVSRPVILDINGQSRQIRTHYQTVGEMIQEMDLTLEAEDIVSPPRNTDLSPGETVTIQLARPVTIEADAKMHQRLTHHQIVGDVLAEVGLTTNRRDEILINGQPVTLQTPLPATFSTRTSSVSAIGLVQALFTATTPQGTVATSRPDAVTITIHRATPLTLYDEETSSTFYSVRSTVGEALREQGVPIFPADKVTPKLNTRLSPGMEIQIERSVPVTINLNDRIVETRTLAKTVGELLAQEGVALMGQDFSRPDPNQAIVPNQSIDIVRVRETIEIEQEIIPFETEWIPDEKLLLDQQEVRQTGQSGVLKNRTRIRYENGQEVWRGLEDEWLDQEPNNRIIAYGTQIVIRTLETPHGPIEYWRKINMRSTAYSAATSGKSPDHPQYGITRSGLQAGSGVVAVDIRVIPLMTNLYIDGYGPGLAGDTGSRVLGKHIDLGYDDKQPLPNMFGWRDVYVLTPMPPADQIRYVLPQWPQR